MLAVVLRRARGLVGMRMIEAQHVERFFARDALDGSIVVGGNEKAMRGGVGFAAISRRLRSREAVVAIFVIALSVIVMRKHALTTSSTK